LEERLQGGRRGVGRRQARGLTAGEQGKEYSAESECAGESELRNGFHSTASVQFSSFVRSFHF